MKKIISAFIVFLICFVLQAETYQILEAEFKTEGCGAAFFSYTKPYSIEKNVPVNKKKIFTSEEELIEYIKDYELKLYSLRAFEKITLDYTVQKNPDFPSDEIYLQLQKELPAENFVKLSVNTKDSFHLLGVPYPKYDSNTGTVIKLKIKDTNFLGSLNAMSADINFSLLQEKENQKPETNFGLTFSYDHPFHAGIFDYTWVNDYSINYTIGEKIPEWDAKTGLKIEFPVNNLSYTLEFYQKAINNFDYTEYDDAIYFNEEVKFSVPIILHDLEQLGLLKYTPYIDASFNWDKNGINKENSDLSGPNLTLGHSISISRIDWSYNIRDGLSASLSNKFAYNFQRNIVYPYIDGEFKFYKSFELFKSQKELFNRGGICADLFTFIYFVDYDNPYFGQDGTLIGGRLRGIRDEQKFSASTLHPLWYACRPTSAIVLNLDFPYHIFSTNFTKSFLRYFNFDFQLSPFIDMALCYNKITNKIFDPKDGFYAGGLEVLVYPAKWAGFTVRGSVGLDIGRLIFSKYINNDWRTDVSKFEISFGIGLHY